MQTSSRLTGPLTPARKPYLPVVVFPTIAPKPQTSATPNVPELRPLLNTAQTSKILGITTRTLFELTKRGDIPCIKVGRSVRYDVRDIEAYLERNKSKRTEVPNG